MVKTHKYRLYPNKTQERELKYWLRILCDVYCVLVDYKLRLWRSSGRHANEKDLREMFYLIRNCEPDIFNLPQAVFTVLIRFRILPAYRSFFALIKKFKEDSANFSVRPQTIDIKSHNNWAVIKRNRYKSGDSGYAKDLPKRAFDSIQFGADPNNKHARIEGNKLYLSKFKSGGIKMRVHRPVDGELRFIVIKREYDKWYACCSINYEAEPVKIPKKLREVGIDLGVISLVSTSDGRHYAGIQAYKKYALRLETLQSIRSRKQYGSKSYRKICREIGKTWEKVRNARKTIIEQVTHDLVENYDAVYHEDMDISGLLSRDESNGKRKAINKRLTDQAWGVLLRRLTEKMNAIPGKKIVAVSCQYSSQMCSRCYRIHKIALSERVYKCPVCGLELDRDQNAAINLLNFGHNEFGAFIASERWRQRNSEIAAD